MSNDNTEPKYKWSKAFIILFTLVVAILFLGSYGLSIHADGLPEGGEKALLSIISLLSLFPSFVILLWFVAIVFISAPSEKTARWQKTPKTINKE